MTWNSITPRAILGGTAASILASRTPAEPPTRSGFIYVGPREDYGWNQAHAVAAKALKPMPGVKVVEEENVPETVAVRKTMEA